MEKTSEEGTKKTTVSCQNGVLATYNMEDPHNWDVSRFNFFQYLNRLHDDMEVPLIHKTFLWYQKLSQKSLKNRLHLAAQQKVFGIHIYKCSKEQGLLMPLMPHFIL